MVGGGGKYKVRHVLPLYQGEFFEVEAVSVEEDAGEKVWEGFGVRSLVDGEMDLKVYVESGGERDGWVSGILEAKVGFFFSFLFFFSSFFFLSFFLPSFFRIIVHIFSLFKKKRWMMKSCGKIAKVKHLLLKFVQQIPPISAR